MNDLFTTEELDVIRQKATESNETSIKFSFCNQTEYIWFTFVDPGFFVEVSSNEFLTYVLQTDWWPLKYWQQGENVLFDNMYDEEAKQIEDQKLLKTIILRLAKL